jgi:hypothetical protein
MRSPQREQVYRAIDGERAYQDELGPDRKDGSDLSVGDYLVMIDYYHRKAMDDWAKSPGVSDALDELRKVTAIAVMCMEEHGVPERQA